MEAPSLSSPRLRLKLESILNDEGLSDFLPGTLASELQLALEKLPKEQPTDLAVLVMTTAAKPDVLRMDAALDTWLHSSSSGFRVRHFFAVCQDDPCLHCDGPFCAQDRPGLVILPCKHGYKSLITKTIEGYRYIAHHTAAPFVMKIDIDTIVDLACLEQTVRRVSESCKSFGIGLWSERNRPLVNDSWKFVDPFYAKHTGLQNYLPYPSGMLSVWSADVVRFLGMAGLPDDLKPRWQSKWTMEDAAVGAFVIGLETCRMALECPTDTDLDGALIRQLHVAMQTAGSFDVGEDGAIAGFVGPVAEAVVGNLDLANIHTVSLGRCAFMCAIMPSCVGLEYSPEAQANDFYRRCRLAATDAQSTSEVVVLPTFLVYRRTD